MERALVHLRRLVVTIVLALIFASPAAAVSIHITNNSSMPDQSAFCVCLALNNGRQ